MFRSNKNRRWGACSKKSALFWPNRRRFNAHSNAFVGLSRP
jgi:hypothetical protein